MSRTKQIGYGSPSIAAICIGLEEKEIATTLRSIAKVEAYIDEIIIVDSSATGLIEYPLKDNSKLTHIRELPAAGISNAFNTGVRSAKSEFLIFYNGGDECLADGLIKTVNTLIAHPECQIIAGDVILAYSDKRTPWKPRIRNNKAFQIHHIGTLYKKSIHNFCGMYDPSLHYAMDYAFFRKALEHIPTTSVEILDMPVGIFQMGGASSRHAARKNLEVLSTDLLTSYGLARSLLSYLKSSVALMTRSMIRRILNFQGSKISASKASII
jgi:glycosyltransferase involved in cell wall biosynthesis